MIWRTSSVGSDESDIFERVSREGEAEGRDECCGRAMEAVSWSTSSPRSSGRDGDGGGKREPNNSLEERFDQHQISLYCSSSTPR